MLNLKWTEYCEQHNTDALFFFDPKNNNLIVIREGNGDNLLDEDEEEGYVDYWYATVYDKSGEIGGGMQLLENYIQEENQTIEELINNFEENSALFDEVPSELKSIFIDPTKGKELEEFFGKIDRDMFHLKIAQANLDNYLEKNYN